MRAALLPIRGHIDFKRYAESGYETSWPFQLLLFAIFRIPIWIAVLEALALSVRMSAHPSTDRDVLLR
jgi:hypothetical protein